MGFENEDNMKEVIEESAMIERGYKKLEEIEGFWSGSDIKMKNKETISPNSSIETKLILNKDNFPSSIDLDWGVFRCLNFSTRSFLAQAGIEVVFDSDALSYEDFEKINKGEDVYASVRINNYGLSPIEVSGDVVRLFWANEKNRLRGDELREVLSSGEVEVEGKEGEDWFLGDVGYDLDEEDEKWMEKNMRNEEFAKNSKDAMIVFPAKKIMYIPQNNEVLKIDSKADLENALEPVPDNVKNLDLRVAETPIIHLSDNVCGVINTGSYNNGKRHIKSPLVDSGFEGPIRSELMQGLDYFEMYIYKR